MRRSARLCLGRGRLPMRPTRVFVVSRRCDTLVRRQKQRWVNERLVERHCPMQMRPGHTTRRPHFAEHVATLHMIADFYADLTEMAVHRDQPLTVIHDHRVSAEEEIPSVEDSTVRRRFNGRPSGRSDIHPTVRVARLIVEYAPQAV